ncbi:MAG: hypothetical protein ACE5FB_05625 [Candidatus Binatia bacterium]
MKGVRIFTMLCCLMVLLATAMEAQAATARARCRVRDGRVRVQVDGQDLAPGTYTAKVTNQGPSNTGAMETTEGGKEQTATAAAPDVDLDFDSTADPDDADSPIGSNFAAQGDSVKAEVNLVGGTMNPLAMATDQCER